MDVHNQTDPLTIQRGKQHEYLGMTTFQRNGDVVISMYDYVKKLIDKLPEDMIGHKPTAALDCLHKTNWTNALLLNQAKADEYHSLKATVLYLGIRTQVDLQIATGFLCTQMKAPNEHDWKKLGHLMKYLQTTAFLLLIFRSNSKGSINYVDGSHDIHADMKGHGGMFATKGKGAMYSLSTKYLEWVLGC